MKTPIATLAAILAAGFALASVGVAQAQSTSQMSTGQMSSGQMSSGQMSSGAMPSGDHMGAMTSSHKGHMKASKAHSAMTHPGAMSDGNMAGGH